jgi:hypothetical protein
MAKNLNRPLQICWNRDNFALNADFSSLFEPVPFGFVEKIRDKKIPTQFIYKDVPERSFSIDHQSQFHFRNIDTSLKEELAYFHPLNSLEDEINTYLRRFDFKNVIGFHIRKTDKVWESGHADLRYTQFNKDLDKINISLMQEILSINKNIKFYLASDESLDNYKILGDAVIFQDNQNRNRNVEGVQKAIIDMWLLSKTGLILRGPGTFGACAAKIKGIPSINIFGKEEIGNYSMINLEDPLQTKFAIFKMVQDAF